MSNKVKIASRVCGFILFSWIDNRRFNNFLQNIFANINNSDFCKIQPLFKNLFIANITLALICERPTIYLK